MKDELKEYIKQNRAEFELYKLEHNVLWSGIESRLDDQEATQLIPWKKLFSYAAAVLLLLSISFGYYLNEQRVENKRNGIALQDVSNDLADTEAYYSMQIDEKLSLIRLKTRAVDSDLLVQMKIFDDDYLVLKKDLQDNADSEEVINAMIEHYRLKLAMLAKILSEIDKDNVRKEHDKTQAI